MCTHTPELLTPHAVGTRPIWTQHTSTSLSERVLAQPALWGDGHSWTSAEVTLARLAREPLHLQLAKAIHQDGPCGRPLPVPGPGSRDHRGQGPKGAPPRSQAHALRTDAPGCFRSGGPSSLGLLSAHSLHNAYSEAEQESSRPWLSQQPQCAAMRGAAAREAVHSPHCNSTARHPLCVPTRTPASPETRPGASAHPQAPGGICLSAPLPRAVPVVGHSWNSLGSWPQLQAWNADTM